MIGVAVAVLLAWRQRPALDRLGWSIILTSLAAGLLMGLYAFDGPLATPEFLGSYNEFARRLSRLAHSYCVVFGMLAIFVAREMPQPPDRTQIQRVGISLFVIGSIVTIAVMLLQMLAQFPTIALAVGPAMVVVATLMCIGKSQLQC